MTSSAIVQKLWNYCSILRDDGLSYGDYVEQLTFLLFLKMADEQSKAPFNKPSPIPKNVDWQSLLRLDGDELETHYRHVLESLGDRVRLLHLDYLVQLLDFSPQRVIRPHPCRSDDGRGDWHNNRFR